MADKGTEMMKHMIRLKFPTPIRTYAMIHLAYYMRLRPVEISRIKINDINFNKKELMLQNRMGNNTRILPVPEKTIKAIAAYLLTRPRTSHYGNLFLSLKSPHKPISPRTISRYILKTIKHSGLLAPPHSPGHAPKLGRKKGAPGLKTLTNNLFVRIGLTDQMIKILEQDIRDYRHWIESTPYRENSITNPCPTEVSDFLCFIRNKELAKKKLLAPDHSEQPRINGKSDQPSKNRKQPVQLPDVYERYLLYHKQSQKISDHNAKNVRRVLSIFYDYLNKHHIALSALKIEHLDAFMGEFEVALTTRRLYRSFLRGFLKHLYHEEEIIKRDLAPLLVGPPMFAESIPPKFLRPGEIKKLFASLKLTTPSDIRTYAIVNLTYTLGLRPSEITRITLDDISFRKGELTLRDRKAHNPIILPVPENTLKAVAAYVIKARPTSSNRHVFLTCAPPYRPVSSCTVILCISRIMKKAGLPSSAYWLRHTYAQNLLETGQSIYVIKEMLGHKNIQSSRRYIHIHTELMRKVLFNETL